ncbi:MAG: hypothetical protein M3O36_18670, partial [Myxococcota bacterium]|nr:hypothetical protein [Myxococcota bacterium]
PRSSASRRDLRLVADVNVAVRLVLLLAALGALALGALSAWRRDPAASADGARYTCPMHREVAAAAPDRCPICGMLLVLRAGGFRPPFAPTALDDEGIAVVGPKIFTRAVRAAAWIESPGLIDAHLYGDELDADVEDLRGSFVPTAAQDRSVGVRRVSGAPAPWDASTWVVHFRYDTTEARFEPGTVGWVQIAARPRQALLIPDSAVLQSDKGSYVLAAAPDGSMVRTPVTVGKIFSGNAIVTRGLKDQDRIAVASAFFLDAERRLFPPSEGASGPGP